MPPTTTPEFATERVRAFIASIEGQDVLLGAIASGFGHETPTLFVSSARRVNANWSEARRANLRLKILTGQIDVIGGNSDLKSALASLANALLSFRTPPGRALEIGKILFAILDADVDDLGTWLLDVPPRLVSMGCDRERLVLHLVGHLPN